MFKLFIQFLGCVCLLALLGCLLGLGVGPWLLRDDHETPPDAF